MAAPLLAGFSFTLIGVIAQAPTYVKWPGATMGFLTLAAGLLMFAVQAGFFARQMYWTRADLLAWFSEPPTGEFDVAYGDMNRRQAAVWKTWIDRTRRSYNAGICVLAVGVALLLAPPDTYGDQALSRLEEALRWTAAGLAGLMGLAELEWWRRTRPDKNRIR